MQATLGVALLALLCTNALQAPAFVNAADGEPKDALQSGRRRHARAVQSARGTFCVPDVTLPKSCANRKEDSGEPVGFVESDVTFIIIKIAQGYEPTEIKTDDIESYRNSGYNTSLDTKIIVHGYYSSAKYFEHMVVAYMTAAKYNVILMDWSTLAKWCYCEHVLKKIGALGDVLGKFIDFLSKRGTDMKRVHIVGHSLGAHIAGLGSITSKIGRDRVGRISALDPARPGFTDDSHKDVLRKDRADFVDVIHSSAHSLGIAKPMGHVDFYPNGGQSPQPGCSGVTEDVCSHSRSHYLFTESITTDVGFRSVQCSGWSAYRNGECNSGNSPTANMGERVNKSSPEGTYYLKTGASCPYFNTRNSSPSVLRTTCSVGSVILLFVSTMLLYLT